MTGRAGPRFGVGEGNWEAPEASQKLLALALPGGGGGTHGGVDDAVLVDTLGQDEAPVHEEARRALLPRGGLRLGVGLGLGAWGMAQVRGHG